MFPINKPAWVTLALAVVAGVLQYLTQQTWDLGSWHAVVTYGIFFIGLFGVGPATGNEIGKDLQALFHMSVTLTVTIGSVVFAVATAVQTFGISGDAKAWILAVIAFLTTIGFGPAVGPVAAATVNAGPQPNQTPAVRTPTTLR